MSDPKVQIDISSKYNGAAAKASLADLQDLRRQAYAAGVSTAGLDAEIAAAEKTLGKAGKGAAATSGQIHGLRQAFGFLGRQFGDFGRLAHFAFNPVVLGVALAGIAIRKLLQHLDDLKKKAEEVAKANLAMWEAGRSARIEAANDVDAFTEALKKSATATDTLKQKEDEELAILKEIQTARDNILKTKEAEELAAAKGDAVKEAEIKARYGELQTQSKLRNEAAELEVKQTNRQKAQSDAAEAALTAQEKLVDLEQYRNAKAGPAAANTVAIEKLTKEGVDLETKRQLAFGGKSLADLKAAAEAEAAAPLTMIEGGGMPQMYAGVQYEKALAAQKAVAKNQREWMAAQVAANVHQQELARRKKAADDATADMVTKQADARERGRQFEISSQIYDIHRGNVRDVRGLSTSERGPAQTIAAAASGAQAIIEGGKATSAEAQAINEAVKAFGLRLSKDVSWDMLLRLLARMTDTMESNTNAIKNLERRQGNFRNP